jgi:hypothetical protein
MTKTHILDEIRRTAKANGGVPFGLARFKAETGVKQSEWVRYWARWGDAIREAGFEPNQFVTAFDHSTLLAKYAKLAKEIGRLPASNDLRLKAHSDCEFPSHTVFGRLGPKADLVKQLAEYCRGREGYADVIALCEQYAPRRKESSGQNTAAPEEEFGFVYLMRSGRFYKIGKTNSAGRREREIAIQLPEKAATVHDIRTDDPSGIEAYWHRRFADRRKNGEWFELDAADVRAFKRRKFM